MQTVSSGQRRLAKPSGGSSQRGSGQRCRPTAGCNRSELLGLGAHFDSDLLALSNQGRERMGRHEIRLRWATITSAYNLS